MLKKKNFRKLAILLLIPLVSCLSNDAESDFEVSADAYTIKKMVNDEPAYALTLFVYANQLMGSATATQIGGSGEKINLRQNTESIFAMSKIPEASDYKPFEPAASDFLFDVVSEKGVQVEASDFLDPQNIGIPTISKAEFEDTDKLLKLEWKQVSNVDGYLVKIKNDIGEYIYSGYGVESDVTTYTVNILLGNWVVSADPGENYTIEVHAFAYEADADKSELYYNLQEISIAEFPLTWK